MKRTLSLYIVSEIVPPLFVGLLMFTFILLIARILKLVELVVTRGIPLYQVGKLFGLILPTFLEITLPMALLLGILLGLGRLAGDHEILAFKASGVSPVQILLPVGIIALCVSLATLLITTWLGPMANQAMRKEFYNIAKTRVATAIREKVFNDDFPGILIYVEEVNPPGVTLQGVLMVDRRTPGMENIIFGKVGLVLSDEESRTLSFKLFDGAVYERKKSRPDFSQTRFNTYDFKIDLDEALSPVKKKERAPKEMSLQRLGRTIQLKVEQGLRPTAELMELHHRFSFSFAPLVFGLLGVSLVMVPGRSQASRSWGLTLCLSWLFVYYALLSVGKTLGEREFIPPALAVWLPNVVLGAIAVNLFRKALRESPLLIPRKLEDLSFHITRRLAAYRQRSY